MLLAIDTVSGWGGLALWDGGLRHEMLWRSERNQTAELLPRLKALFDEAGIGWKDVTALAAVVGPGSFNGIRVGLGTAKAIALARKLPLAAVGTLEALSWPFTGVGPVAAVVPAGRDLAVGIYSHSENGPATILAPDIVSVEEFNETVQPAKAIVLGDGAESLIAGHDLAVPAILGTSGLRRPSAAAEIGAFRIEAGVEIAELVHPIYLRRPHITMPKS
jgi:tRNA threonylcarbamoyladenosine biosynthesis protein TsaB